MPLAEFPSDAVAEVYARSLFDLAKEAGGREAVEAAHDELAVVVNLGRSDPNFGEFLGSRTIPTRHKRAALSKIFKDRLSERVLNFLLVINEKGRLPRITALLRALSELVQEEFGRVEVDVRTAAPLDAAQEAGLRQRLSTVLKNDVIVRTKVDPALIGGIRVQLGDHLIDASVATQLRRIREQFEQSGLPAVRAIAGRLA